MANYGFMKNEKDSDFVKLSEVEDTIMSAFYDAEHINDWKTSSMSESYYHPRMDLITQVGFSILMGTGGGHVTKESCEKWIAKDATREEYRELFPFLDGTIYTFHGWR